MQLGNYRLGRLLGVGGFAEVYLGEHIYLKTPAAIKVLHMHLKDDILQQFLTEARTIAHLEHPHIVRVLEFGIEGTTPYLVMGYARNGTIRHKYPKGKIVPLPFLIRYTRQIADALQYAHNHNVIHRDIKPENILLGRKGEALLSDFGLAIVTSSADRDAYGQAGTTLYMAPEQIQGNPGPASDQYSLGIVVYEWLSGLLPFTGSDYEIAMHHLQMPPPSLQERVPSLPLAIEQVVMRALEKDPDKRFPSVQHFAQELQQAYHSHKSELSTNPGTDTSSSKLVPLSEAPTSSFNLSEASAPSFNAMSRQSEIFEQPLVTSSDINNLNLSQPTSHLAAPPSLPITSPEPFQEESAASSPASASSPLQDSSLQDKESPSHPSYAFSPVPQWHNYPPGQESFSTIPMPLVKPDLMNQTAQEVSQLNPAVSSDQTQRMNQESSHQLPIPTRPARRLSRRTLIAGASIAGIAVLGGGMVAYLRTSATNSRQSPFLFSNNQNQPPAHGSTPTTTAHHAQATPATSATTPPPSTPTTHPTATPSTVSTTGAPLSSNPTPTSIPVQPTPTTPPPTPTPVSAALTVQIGSLPDQVTKNSDVTVTVITNKSGVSVTVQVTYSSGDPAQNLGPQTTGSNGQAPIVWNPRATRLGKNTVYATLAATATNTNGQQVTSSPVQTQVVRPGNGN